MPEGLFLKNVLDKPVWVLISVLVILGFILRFWNLPHQLFWGPEQGIDALVVKEMVEDGKLRLIGPKTDIDGIFHGPHFYYLSAVSYLLSGGNPLFSIAWAIVFSSLSIPLLYLVARQLFSQKIAILSTIFYTVSYGAIVYSRWLSTHNFVPFFFLLSLYLFLKARKNQILLPLSFFFGAFTAQLEILNVFYLVPLYTFLLIVYRRSFSKLNIIFSAFLFFASFSNFLLFDLRHEFLITKRIMAVLRGEAGFSTDYLSAFKVTFSTYLNEGAFFLLPLNLAWGKIIFVFLVFLLLFAIIRKTKLRQSMIILLVWLATPIVVLSLTRQEAMSQFFVILGPAFVLLLAYVLGLMAEKKALRWMIYSFAVFLAVLHLWFFVNFLPKNKLMFFQAPQPNFYYGDELAALDYVYQDAKGEKFSFVAYTIPYWMDQGWQYLFSWYGLKKYGFVPEKGEGGTFYILWQKDYNNLSYQNDWFAGLNRKSKILSENQFGEVRVQKREQNK